MLSTLNKPVDDTNSRLTEILTSFAKYLTNCESVKHVTVNKPVVKPNSVLTVADITQPTIVKKTKKIKEKSIKTKTQKIC